MVISVPRKAVFIFKRDPVSGASGQYCVEDRNMTLYMRYITYGIHIQVGMGSPPLGNIRHNAKLNCAIYSLVRLVVTCSTVINAWPYILWSSCVELNHHVGIKPLHYLEWWSQVTDLSYGSKYKATKNYINFILSLFRSIRMKCRLWIGSYICWQARDLMSSY